MTMHSSHDSAISQGSKDGGSNVADGVRDGATIIAVAMVKSAVIIAKAMIFSARTKKGGQAGDQHPNVRSCEEACKLLGINP